MRQDTKLRGRWSLSRITKKDVRFLYFIIIKIQQRCQIGYLHTDKQIKDMNKNSELSKNLNNE
jgi:hypothetical protein